MSIKSILTTAALAALFVLPSVKSATAEDADQRFCIVPVKGGAAGDGAAGETWRLTSNDFQIPGLPAPVFTPSTVAGQWTIDADRRLVAYTGPYPKSYLDTGHWVREPWSGRVIAITYGGGVSILAPGSDHFQAIESTTAKKTTSYSAISLLPRRRQTVVIDNERTALVVEGDALRPWLSAEELSAHGIHGIRRLYDSSFLSATIVRDTDNVLHALTDEGEWYKIGSTEGRDDGYLLDVSASVAALLFANQSVLALRKSDVRSTVSFVSEPLDIAGAGVTANYYVSHLFGRVLAYQGGFFSSPQWRHLTPQGFVNISGGDFRIPKKELFEAGPYVHDLPTLGRTLVEGADRLYLYDGTSIEPVRNGERERYGELSRVYDLPSIGRVLVTTKSGIFELTRDGALVARPMPFPAEGIFPKPEIVDWPEAGIALTATKIGIFALDRDLNATPIPGGDRIDLFGLDFAHGQVARTGDIIVTGHRGIFLAVDSRRAGGALCQHERQLRQAIPNSDFCLRPVAGTDESSVGDVIGNMVEAPEDRGLLVDTVTGLFLQKDDGTFVNLQPRDGHYTRNLARLPWSGEAIAIMANDTVIHSDLSIEEFSKHQYSKLIGVFPSIQSALIARGGEKGPVRLLRFDTGRSRLIDTKLERIEVAVDAPWFGTPVLVTRSGLLSIDRDGVLTPFAVSQPEGQSPPASLTPSLATYTQVLLGASDFFAIDRYQTIYVRHQRDGWFRITRDRQWLPVRGLPNEPALEHFDPGAGEVLFGMLRGIFAVSVDGEAREIAGDSGPKRRIRAFAKSGGSIIAGGDEGLFEIGADLSSVTPVANGSIEMIGSVRDIVEVGFGDFSIVETSNGTYAFENGSFRRIRDLSAASRASDPFVFPRLRRVLVTKRFEAGPLLFELARYDGEGQCTRPIAETTH
jgi:hypothetical protein